MVMFNTPFRGQQELSLIGAEETTGLLVVMVSLSYIHKGIEELIIQCLGFSVQVR